LFTNLPRGPSTVTMRVLMCTFTMVERLDVLVYWYMQASSLGVCLFRGVAGGYVVVTYRLLGWPALPGSECTAWWATIEGVLIVEVDNAF